MSGKRMFLKIEQGKDGRPIGRLANGKIVLFKMGGLVPPIGRVCDCIIHFEDPTKCIAEYTGLMKPIKR